MQEYPGFRINSSLKKFLNLNTVVINKDAFQYYLWVRIPDLYVREYRMYHIQKVGTTVEPLCILNFVEYMGGPWYKILGTVLDKTPGYHEYQMQMVNRYNDDTVYLYFAYTLQDDSPDKPYIYMKKSENCSRCCNVSSENRVS